MKNKSAWIITLGADEQPARAIASQLTPYGLHPKGQRWSVEDKAWIGSAQEAAKANAAVIILTGEVDTLANPVIRRQLALFRLALQTLRQSVVNGFIFGAAPSSDNEATSVLGDWLAITDTQWPAKIVARAYAPIAPAWPVRLGLHAHERLGIWLETHPAPGQTVSGAMLGVSGNNAVPDFHAVGSAGALPEKSVNEYELKGLKFQVREHSFDAWALQNTLAPDQSYYVRLEGEPDVLAIGSLPNGNVSDVNLIHLG